MVENSSAAASTDTDQKNDEQDNQDLASTPLGRPQDLGGSKSISPPHVQRIPISSADKKCFVKIVAIGDSGVGKTSLI